MVSPTSVISNAALLFPFHFNLEDNITANVSRFVTFAIACLAHSHRWRLLLHSSSRTHVDKRKEWAEAGTCGLLSAITFEIQWTHWTRAPNNYREVANYIRRDESHGIDDAMGFSILCFLAVQHSPRPRAPWAGTRRLLPSNSIYALILRRTRRLVFINAFTWMDGCTDGWHIDVNRISNYWYWSSSSTSHKINIDIRRTAYDIARNVHAQCEAAVVMDESSGTTRDHAPVCTVA